MMTNLVTVPSFRKLDTEVCEFYEDLYTIAQDKRAITFTVEGAAYYRGWFQRFGFAFAGIDAHTFFTTVRDINRLLWDMQPVDEQELARRDPEAQAVWSLWQQGRFEEFTPALVALTEKRIAQGGGQVIPLFGPKPDN